MDDERDREAGAGYREPVATLLTLGDVRGQPRFDYGSLGLGAEHIPELARLAADRGLYWGDSESTEVWAPIHAWRALADLRAEAAIDALVGVLSLPAEEDDDGYDDWIGEELPEAFAAIGPAAIPALAAYLRDPDNQRWARSTAGEAIGQIAKAHPETRDEAVAIIAEVVEAVATHPEPTTEDDEIINGSLIAQLMELRAVEAAPAIERAFAAGRVDPTFVGDWEDVQVEFGLLAERVTPARNYIRERLFGDLPAEDVDRLLDLLGRGIMPGTAVEDDDPADDEVPDEEGDFGPEPFAPRYEPTVIGPSKERQGETARKAKQKRKMAKESRKQNRKKKK